jgi:hypothetical protein
VSPLHRSGNTPASPMNWLQKIIGTQEDSNIYYLAV